MKALGKTVMVILGVCCKQPPVSMAGSVFWGPTAKSQQGKGVVSWGRCDQALHPSKCRQDRVIMTGKIDGQNRILAMSRRCGGGVVTRVLLKAS